MKNFFQKNKVLIIVSSIIVILFIGLYFKSFGMEQIENVSFSLGIVNTDYLNMRTGPSITFTSIDILTKNEYVRILGKIGDWYIIQNEENQIGTVHSKYITETEDTKTSATNSETIEEVSNSSLSSDEQDLLNLINDERKKNNLNEFKIDEELQNVAKLKAEDLVKNNYFSHNSPTYGSPYEMLKEYNISYKTGSENIAGNKDINSAFESFMNSETHKNNILSHEYHYTGIAVVDSIAYGKIIVEFFIGR